MAYRQTDFLFWRRLSLLIIKRPSPEKAEPFRIARRQSRKKETGRYGFLF
jgi:hypothetical protein